MGPFRAAVGPALVVLGLRLALSAGVMGCFAARYGYGAGVVAGHLAVLAPLLLLEQCVLFALLCSRRVRGSQAARLAVALVPTTSTLLLGALYVTDFLTQHWFGQNVTLSFAATYLAGWRDVTDLAPPAWLPLGGALLVATSVALAWSCARLLAAWTARWSPARWGARGGTLAVLGSAVVALSCVAALQTLRQQLRWDAEEFWLGEPLTNLVLLERWNTFVSASPQPERIAAEAELFRSYRGRGDGRNVVLVLVDSMRPDHLPIYGYARDTTPYLSELHRRGELQRVARAYAACPESFCGILATLSSKEFPRLTRRDFRLHHALKRAGYANRFVVAGDHDYYGLRRAYGPDIDHFFDHRSHPRLGMLDDDLVLEGLEAVPAYQGKPTFFFLFLISAHMMLDEKPAFRVWEPSLDAYVWGEAGSDAALREQARNRHDNGVLQADHHLARALGTLRAKGYLEDALVVIAADHGDGLGEKGYYGHSYNLFEEDIRIPLLVWDSRGRPLRNDAFASQIDVAPTILDGVGLPIPSTWQGRSLFSDGPRRLSFHHTPRRGRCDGLLLREGAALTKYLRCAQPVAGRGPEMVYDLDADPAERHNLLAALPRERLEALRRLLDESRGSGLPAVAAGPAH